MSPRQFLILLVAVMAGSAACPQSPPSFEVASIRPSGPQSVGGTDGGPGHRDPTRFTAGATSLRLLIAIAWDVDYYFQIESPVTLDKQNFDLVAKVPEGATKEQFRVMLQNLLKERFALKMHIESREFPAYELVVAKAGLKLKEAAAGEAPPVPKSAPRSDGDVGWPVFPPNVPRMVAQYSMSGGYQLVRLRAQLQTLSQLAAQLKIGPGEPPIVDKTGLAGKYTFTLEYTKDLPGATPDAPPPAPALVSALPQQLGLQLVSKKLPFDVVVVESFNKLPTEN